MNKLLIFKCIECGVVVKSWESCSSCGTPLCKECSDKQNELCDYCLIHHNRKETYQKVNSSNPK